MKAFFGGVFATLVLVFFGLLLQEKQERRDSDLRATLAFVVMESNHGYENTGTYRETIEDIRFAVQSRINPITGNPVSLSPATAFPRMAKPGAIYFRPLRAPDWLMSDREAVKPGTIMGSIFVIYGADGKPRYAAYDFPGAPVGGVVDSDPRAIARW